jgi:hypothetical protein
MSKILYAYNERIKDYVFLVKWKNTELGKNYSLIFDCYNDEWRDDGDEVIRAFNVMNTIDPVDLKMAGSYIHIYEDKGIQFPQDIRKEFLKLALTSVIKKNP